MSSSAVRMGVALLATTAIMTSLSDATSVIVLENSVNGKFPKKNDPWEKLRDLDSEQTSYLYSCILEFYNPTLAPKGIDFDSSQLAMKQMFYSHAKKPKDMKNECGYFHITYDSGVESLRKSLAEHNVQLVPMEKIPQHVRDYYYKMIEFRRESLIQHLAGKKSHEWHEKEISTEEAFKDAVDWCLHAHVPQACKTAANLINTKPEVNDPKKIATIDGSAKLAKEGKKLLSAQAKNLQMHSLLKRHHGLKVQNKVNLPKCRPKCFK